MDVENFKPIDSLIATIATDSRDWSVDRKDAWIYGIICGWENDNPIIELGESRDDALDEICKNHRFDKSRIEKLRSNFLKLQDFENKTF